MSAKKIAKVTSHLDDETHAYIEAMADLNEMSPSEYLRNLSKADYEEKKAFVERMAPIFGFAKRGESAESAQGSKAAFLRLIQFPETGTDS